MKLGDILRRWRRSADLSTREAAAEIGLSVATLNRIERGMAFDGKTLAVILRWLMK